VTPDYQFIEQYGDAVPTVVVEGVKLIRHTLLLGKRRAIAGVEKALTGMSPGSYREVIIPPHLGYGARGLGNLIPPNALLKAKLWVHTVQPAAA
jgi:FKBP-type peptidyl-prolyl cis-trans isomerase 2